MVPSPRLLTGVLAVAIAAAGAVTAGVHVGGGPGAVRPAASGLATSAYQGSHHLSTGARPHRAASALADRAVRREPAATGSEATGSQTSAGSTTAAATTAARPGWARASVATVWVKPNRVRPVDRPALRRHPHIARWIDHMTMAQRLDLGNRVMTQVLRGDRLVIQHRRADGWTRVRLPDQTGSAFPTGIVGWIPARQLSTTPVSTPATAAVPKHPTGAQVLRVARDYLGVRYLWGGMSHQGIDCSGLTYQVFHSLGITLARDAADQGRHGRWVGKHHLQVGDLVFFGSGGWRTIHHVGIYAGGGLVLHAPRTGSRVQITPLRAWSDYWGARRYL